MSDTPVTLTMCEQHRKDIEKACQIMIRESEARTQKEIAEMKTTLTTMAQKIDAIPWQLVAVCCVIIGAIVVLAVV